MMMTSLGFAIVVIFGVVTSQNHDMTRKRSVEATTLIPPDPKVNDEGTQMLLTRLEALCMEKLDYLIADTNQRFQSLENQLTQGSSCPASPIVQNFENLEAKVENLGKNIQELMDASRNLSCPASPVVQNNENLEVKVENLEAKVENLGKNIQELMDASKNLSCPAFPIVQNIENLEAKVENLDKNIQELMDATRNLPSKMEPIKRNVSAIINTTSTRSLVDLSSNSIKSKSNPKNCKEVRKSEITSSGTYIIQPENATKPFEVVCELETRGGGWTVIQRRFDGTQDFYLNWQDYKDGFGNLAGEFWLGLENIHLLTGFEDNELLIELGDFESKNKSASYSKFSVGSQMEEYSLKVLGVYSGDAGDDLPYNARMKFKTKDKDTPSACALRLHGAWWYIDSGCTRSNLNGKYLDRGQIPENYARTLYWFGFTENNYYYSLKHTRMLVRPKV